jgi:hypothetical protein
MSVAATAVVTLGKQQHMVAQRWELAVTERTRVGGRLGALGAHDLPPPGWICHRLSLTRGPSSADVQAP